MPTDVSMYNALGARPRSMADFDAENMDAQGKRQNLLMGQQKLDAYSQDQADRQSLRNALSGVDINTDAGRAAAVRAAGAQGPTLQKQFAETQKAQGEADLQVLNAQKMRLEHGVAVQAQIAQAAGAATDQASWERGLQIAQSLGADVSKVPAQFDPATAKNLHDQALNSYQQLEAAWKAHDQKIADLTQAETVRHNQADEKITVRGQDVTANTSRANNRDTIAAENIRAGVGAGGALDDNSERTAQGIASGALPAPTGMALLNPKNQRILGRVMEINPQYDYTTVAAKKAAAVAFGTGQQGVQLNKFATTGEHLDQLMPLIDGLKNGDNQTVNTIGNAVSKWNGGTAVTTFDAVKAVATKEMMAALVAGGGDAAERKELSDSLRDANSPKQLKGVVGAYRGLMKAKEENLIEQRRAAGLPDSTLPHYHTSDGAAVAPADDLHSRADAILRGGK